MHILQENIQDNRFLRLIEGALKAGYCEEWTHHPSLSGSPQGGIVSPILSNIYLDRLALQRRLNIDTLTFSWYLFPYTQNSTRRQQMFPACRTAGEAVAIPQFALTRSDLHTFMDELRGVLAAFGVCVARQVLGDQLLSYVAREFRA